MTTRTMQDQNLEKHMEKQMGCMTGFFQLFDRNQLLTGKRLYTTKRLPSSVAADSSSETEKSVESPAISRELVTPPSTRSLTSPSPERFKPSPDIRSPLPEMLPKSPLPLPIFELKEGTKSSWKFCKEAPRLSLDSRAIVDAKGSLYPREIRTNSSIASSANQTDSSVDRASVDGDDKQRRSPSVIARLMGLEQLPHSQNPEPMKKAELRRSASESRVSRDLSQYNNFQLHQPHSIITNQTSNASRDNVSTGHNNSNTIKSNVRNVDPMESLSRSIKSEPARTRGGSGVSPWKSPQQRKSYFDSADVFPEPKQTMSVYGEIEKRLRMRGIDEPAKDLETLKQILEALQLKGLLHSKRPNNQINNNNNKNFVYDQRFSSNESPIVVMKPWRSSTTSPVKRRIGNDSPPSSFRSNSGIRQNYNLAGECLSPVIDRNVRSPTRTRNSSSPTRNESAKSTSSLVKRKALGVETQRRVNEPTDNRRISPINSPKLTPKRYGTDQTSTNRFKKSSGEIYSNAKITTTIVTEDESSSISESSVSTSSQTDTERCKMEEYKEGKSLLERCDKLLHSIAEMNNAASELQPSPVSVLDSSFYKDVSLSPSPVMKRSISFQGVESEEDAWSPISAVEMKSEENSDDNDFVYISEILRASNYLPEDSDVFLLLEKQQYLKGKNTSKIATLERKIIFDTITEILDRNRQLPPWKGVEKSSLQQIWSEFERIRQHETADDLFEIICRILKKDLAGDAINGWGDCPVEMSDAVLYIERLIFKDLIDESIRDLADFAGKSNVLAPRRKLVF
ncbi:hypothetical protein LguiB_000295 [Lonicera macranthoides]